MATDVIPPIDPETQEPVYDHHPIAIGGVGGFRVQLRYLARTDRWYLTLDAPDGTRLLSGKMMAIDYPLIWRYRGAAWPDGVLQLVDVGGTGAECGFEDLGRRCKLVFVPRSDLQPRPNPPVTIDVVEVGAS